MLIGCLVSQTGALAWAGLGNWLPFIWGFWAFQPYVRSSDQRRWAARALVAGTVPVLITGFGQMLLGWSGPWQLLGGGIVWFVAPGGHPEGRLSGLFDYANVAGAWLAVVWPLSLAAVLRRRDPLWCRAIAMLLASALVAAVVLAVLWVVLCRGLCCAVGCAELWAVLCCGLCCAVGCAVLCGVLCCGLCCGVMLCCGLRRASVGCTVL